MKSVFGMRLIHSAMVGLVCLLGVGENGQAQDPKEPITGRVETTFEGKGFQVEIGGAKPFKPSQSQQSKRKEHDPRFVGKWKLTLGGKTVPGWAEIIDLHLDGSVSPEYRLSTLKEYKRQGIKVADGPTRWTSRGGQLVITYSLTMFFDTVNFEQKNELPFAEIEAGTLRATTQVATIDGRTTTSKIEPAGGFTLKRLPAEPESNETVAEMPPEMVPAVTVTGETSTMPQVDSGDARGPLETLGALADVLGGASVGLGIGLELAPWGVPFGPLVPPTIVAGSTIAGGILGWLGGPMSPDGVGLPAGREMGKWADNQYWSRPWVTPQVGEIPSPAVTPVSPHSDSNPVPAPQGSLTEPRMPLPTPTPDGAE